MKRYLLCSVVTALLPVGAGLASIAPIIPPSLMPPAQRPDVPIPSTVDLPRPIPDPGGPMTFQRLQHINVSGVLYNTLLDEAERQAAVAQTSSTEPTNSLANSPLHFRERVASQRSAGTMPMARAHATLDALGGSTANVSNDSTNQDVEPTVTSVNINGTQNTATATTKYVPCWNAPASLCTTLYVYNTTDLQNYTGPARLSVPLNHYNRYPEWDSMGDSLMSVNPYTGGVWGKRMYCTGILYDRVNPASNPSAIAVWHSDDGGIQWSDAALVETVNGGGYQLDKPAITVSWEASSLGYVYVAYILYDYNDPSQSQLHVAVSKDGGVGFTPVNVATANVEYPAVVVDSQGTVNPIWMNLTSKQIQTTQSHDYGSNYANAPTGPFDIVSSSYVIQGQTIPGFATGRANSVPMARYDWAASRIAVVYYGQNNGGNYQVYYTFKPDGSTWSPTPIPITTSAYDHFNAALDYNKANGYLIVPYYRSYNSGGVVYYGEDFAYLDPNGVVQQADVTISPASSRADQQTPYAGFIGDYQDVWDDYFPSEEAATAWIGVGIYPDTGTVNGDDCQTPISY